MPINVLDLKAGKRPRSQSEVDPQADHRCEDHGRGRLDALALVDAGEARSRPGSVTSGSWHCSYPGQEPHARIGYVGNMLDLENASITLDYRVNDQPMRYSVGLVSTVPGFGGRRWWFLCPLARKDGGPPRRAANLHLPPGGRYFGSRQAYGLSYRSSNESWARRRLFKRLAAQMGTDEASIRRALQR